MNYSNKFFKGLKFYLVILFLGLFYVGGLAQKDLRIDFSVTNCETFRCLEKWASLRANNSSALYTEAEISIVQERNGNEEWVEKIVNQSYKSLDSNVVWTLEDRKSVVKEVMNLFQWKFTEDSDTILSYLCRKAIAEFRGRKYEAWFTMDLPFRAAPWKIHGLPGVVLKLAVDKDYYLLEATKISIVETSDEIQMPFKDGKSVSWDDYIIAYKKEKEEFKKQEKAWEIKFGRKYDLSFPKIEVITEKNKVTFEEMEKLMN